MELDGNGTMTDRIGHTEWHIKLHLIIHSRRLLILEASRDDLTNACTNLSVYRVYLGIHIHEIALSADVGYHIGYLVDLASLLCLSFLFSFSFAYESAKLSMCSLTICSPLFPRLSLPTKEVSTIANVVSRTFVTEKRIRCETRTACSRFHSSGPPRSRTHRRPDVSTNAKRKDASL